MARSLWTGAISFGLVNLPVQLYPATRQGAPRFHLLHGKDHAPVRYERVCTREGKPVAWAEIVKGYEYAKGHYAVLTKEDFEKAALEKSRTIDILSFVGSREVDARYFETPYYVVPGKGGERAYALLREAIRRADKVGVAQVILRQKQHLAALSVVGEALVLITLRFAHDVADLDGLSFPGARQVRDKELEIATMLVRNLEASWRPSEFRDQYEANLRAIIKSKSAGKEPRLSMRGAAAPDGEVADLMQRLRESLAKNDNKTDNKIDHRHTSGASRAVPARQKPRTKRGGARGHRRAA